MRNPKFRYVWKHETTGRIMTDTRTLDEIQNGDYHAMACETFGYNVNVLAGLKALQSWQLIARDQFTGRKDKNGTEIYEGDTDGIVVVAWDEDGLQWVLVEKNIKYIVSDLNSEQFEVTGNIHE